MLKQAYKKKMKFKVINQYNVNIPKHSDTKLHKTLHECMNHTKKKKKKTTKRYFILF